MTPLLAQRPRSDRAFERMYRRHVGDVYRYALAVMRNPADAEDVTQTTFLNAYRAYVEKGNRPEKPQNWLIAIAHNVCRQRFRQSARRPSEVSFEDDIADTVVDDDTPSGEDIRRALGHLAFNQRAALVMRELEGRSYAEIAEILELSPSAVERMLSRARRALREQLETSLTCGEAELAISKQLDGRLGRAEKAALRAHLRECDECATFARRQRAQRTAIKSLAAIPVPTSLTSLFGGGGGAALGTGLALKAAAALTAGALVGGAGYEGVQHAVRRHQAGPSAAQTVSSATANASARQIVASSERTGPANANGRAAVATPKQHGKSHVKYHGDASIAARHNHQKAKPSHPARSGNGSNGKSATAPGHGKPRAKPVPPGPYDAGPSPKSKGHSRGGGGGGGGH